MTYSRLCRPRRTRSLTERFRRTACRRAWGEPHWQVTVLPGVTWFSTPSHGGFIVSDEKFSLDSVLRNSEHFRGLTVTRGGNRRATFYEFEEDAAWTVLCLVHPEVLELAKAAGIFRKSIEIDYCAAQVARWYPELGLI